MSTHAKLEKKPRRKYVMLEKRDPKYSTQVRVECLNDDTVKKLKLDELKAAELIENDPEALMLMQPLLSFDSCNMGPMIFVAGSNKSGTGQLLIDQAQLREASLKLEFVEKEALLFTEMLFNSSKNNIAFESARQRGGSRAILVRLEEFDSSDKSQLTSSELSSWSDHIFDLVKQPISFLTLSFMESDRYPQIFKKPSTPGWFILVVFQRELSSSAITSLIQYDPQIQENLPKKWHKIPCDSADYSPSPLKTRIITALQLSQILLIMHKQSQHSQPISIENIENIKKKGKSKPKIPDPPLPLTQNYLLKIFGIVNHNRESLMLRQLAMAMQWRTNI